MKETCIQVEWEERTLNGNNSGLLNLLFTVSSVALTQEGLNLSFPKTICGGIDFCEHTQLYCHKVTVCVYG